MESQIKKLLESKGKKLKKKQIAKMIGVTPQTLYNWQQNLTEPTMTQFEKLKEIIESHNE